MVRWIWQLFARNVLPYYLVAVVVVAQVADDWAPVPLELWWTLQVRV
jgi:hypothetical protein